MTYQVWTRRTERPLLIAAVIFLVVVCMPIIEPDLHGLGRTAVRSLDVGIWALFAVDYVVRLKLVDDRRRFVRAHIPDLLVVVLPALRPLRLLRLLSLARLLARRGTNAIVADVGWFVASAAALLVFVAAVLTLDAERHAKGANITSFGDAVWWACTTVTTVGYGDRYPITVQGRVVAVALMVSGVALLGILTAGFAAWFVRNVSRGPQIEQAVKIEAAELRQVLERLTAIEGALTGGGTAGVS
ncbi:MAG: potassium channel family protein [Mycobacteriales bacterium]